MMRSNLIACPACQSSKNALKSHYPGTFINITNLLECESCSMVFADNMPSAEELAHYYSNENYYGEDFDPFNEVFYPFSLALAKSRINFIQSSCTVLANNDVSVLDVGTGNGVFLKVLSDMGISNLDCIEPDATMFKKSNLKIRNHFLDIKEIQNAEYDLISLNQVLEHVHDPQSFVLNLSKLLKKDGFIYIDVPHQDYRFKEDVAPHLTFWNQTSLRSFLLKNKLIPLTIQTAGMKTSDAKIFFNPRNNVKINNPLFAMNLFKRAYRKIRPPAQYEEFQLNAHGSDRIWLRAIASIRS
jgi:2-polyprenyl-3-methyl-5-hydroxy-6-metoxy-1,4-benzoquinol methylase